MCVKVLYKDTALLITGPYIIVIVLDTLTSNPSSWAWIFKESLPSGTFYSTSSIPSWLPFSLDTPRLLFQFAELTWNVLIWPQPQPLFRKVIHLFLTSGIPLASLPCRSPGSKPSMRLKWGDPRGNWIGKEALGWGIFWKRWSLLLKNSKIHPSQTNLFFSRNYVFFCLCSTEVKNGVLQGVDWDKRRDCSSSESWLWCGRRREGCWMLGRESHSGLSHPLPSEPP